MSVQSSQNSTLRVASLKWSRVMPALLACGFIVANGSWELWVGNTSRLFWIWFPLASFSLAYLLIVLVGVAINDGAAVYIRGQKVIFLFPFPKLMELSELEKIEIFRTPSPFPQQALLFIGKDGTSDRGIVSAMVESADVIRERLLECLSATRERR